MATGDHLYLHCLGFTHHGIDCGDGYVIHYEGKHKGGKITRVSKSAFANGKTIHIQEYSGKSNSPNDVVKLAQSKLGESGYDLIFNNCEHFAYYCKTSSPISESRQVNQVAGGAGIITKTGGAVLGGVAAKSALTLMGSTRMAAGAVGIGGLVSSFATDALVGTMLEDDENLPAQEREARQYGRTSGQIASTVGAIGGGIAAAAVGGSVAIAAAVAAPIILGVGIGLGAYFWSKDE